ncbi:LysR family transcriptional regulator [Verminephrobacter eiseniae]|uniref:LysR family transcriptional regulator n=1 Tax=Verminephrobacter eiseniae TaxID=364317 RepID=UPI0022388E85|nr:LysR family transcriptional regulator [Verminephrobacter eiseniae]MCW5230689.1 LysR family transcriptional regulator [Verminephrobacter eiseniae]MCW5292422.1 LysR family transcriptional regulator [Verminephrobacter eiseniae]MCW8185169.1 LysR family transcriptional regulator [Verminephrobacter eiseniae]MCW8223816.1 LysR family transcriptional regulator [Verminephrobacter eiseniae]MCW8234929.1 LysR family transcriptional regulator [Verminephrobacter eiseniae]
MNITFKQLEAFVYSAKLRSFSSAAVKLRATQSAISKRVAQLEQEFGAPLLHRTARGLEMAQAGRRLLPLAEESQRLWARIDHEMGSDQTLRGTFRVGVTELIAMTWLTRFIQRLRQLHPEMSIEPVVDAGLLLFAGLEANQIDIAIMPGTHWGKSYETVKVGQVEDLWVASPSLKIPDRVLKPHEFGLYPVLEQSGGAAKNRYYEAWRAEHKFQFGRLFQTNSTTVLRQLTINGFGISQLALDYVRPDIEAGLLHIVKSDPMPPPMIYGAVYRNDNPGPAVQRIVELAVQMCDFSAGGNPRRAAGNAPPDERRPARRSARPAGRP